MYDLNERISYLQGLIEGLGISDETKEGKAIKVMAGILEEMAYAISDILEVQEEIEEYIDCIDDDLADLEEEVYIGDFVEIDCPNCGEAIEVEPSILAESSTEIICPECGEAFTPEVISWDVCHCEFDEDDWDDDEDDDDWEEEEDEG